MARSAFGGTANDWLFDPIEFGSNTALALADGATTLHFYSAETGGTRYTDLLDSAGAATNQIVVTGHQIPRFQGPDAILGMWFEKNDGSPREYLEARDTAAAASAVAAASTSASAAAASATAAAASAATVAASLATKVTVGSMVLNVKDYGAVGDGVADDAPEIQAAIDAAEAADGTLYFPPGNYRVVGDLAVDSGSVVLRGAGDGAILTFINGGLVYDGDSGYLTEVGLHDLRISRAGTGGAALRFKGGGTATGVAHFNVSNVRVVGSTGECLLIDGSYIGTFVGCYFIAGVTGIKVALDSGTGIVTGNNVSFFGGETQGCGTAASLDTPLGVSFHGHAFEGSTTAGVDLFGNAYGTGFFDCYWEGNAGYDLRVGNSGSVGPIGVVVHGGIALDGAGGKNHSFQLIRGLGIDIRGVAFGSYTLAPILVNEASAGMVRGEARENVHDGNTALAAVLYTAATHFNKTILGQLDLAASVAGTPVTLHKQYTITHDFGSVAANTTSDAALTATGVAVGDDVTVHTNSMLEAGLVPYAVATATNTITLRVANITTAAIDPVARNWRFRVWR